MYIFQTALQQYIRSTNLLYHTPANRTLNSPTRCAHVFDVTLTRLTDHFDEKCRFQVKRFDADNLPRTHVCTAFQAKLLLYNNSCIEHCERHHVGVRCVTPYYVVSAK